LIGRGLAGAISLLAAYFSIQMIRFADLIAIRYCSPIFTVLFAHIFLKEKFNISHLISFILVLLGLLFLIRPSFIFGQFGRPPIIERSFEFIFGTVLALVCALSASSTFLFIKQLINNRNRVHFVTVIFYFSTIGLILSILISIVIHASTFSYDQFRLEKPYILPDIGVALLAGFASFVGQVCFNLAITNESTTRISCLKTIDIGAAFLIEFVFLNVPPHLTSLVGASFIFLSVIVVFIYKHIMAVKKKREEELESDIFEIRL
jgi:drug/metabolite transporter (DMT)-like permease